MNWFQKKYLDYKLGSHKMVGHKCTCGYVPTRSLTDDRTKPKEGDIGCCFNCGRLTIIDSDGTQREPTFREMDSEDYKRAMLFRDRTLALKKDLSKKDNQEKRGNRYFAIMCGCNDCEHNHPMLTKLSPTVDGIPVFQSRVLAEIALSEGKEVGVPRSGRGQEAIIKEIEINVHESSPNNKHS